MTDTMREVFEKWAIGEGLSVAPYGASYLDEKTHTAWITWQAAQAVPVGMRVSVDTSTGEHDAGNRVFAVATGQQDDGRGGLMLLCEEESRNFEQSMPVVGEVVAHQFYDNGKWHNFIDDRHYQNTVAAGYEVRALVVQPTTSIAAAELDALRKDAERYRWIRVATPYRFKQLQDAAITDSGDVVYFHHDWMDAAIDAAIAAEGEKE